MNEELMINEAAYAENEIEQFNEELSQKIMNVESGMEASEELANIETANSVHDGMESEEIAEFQQTQRETYEEFASDFEESDPQEAGYAGITDESAADELEAAADEYFNEERGYESTADYTMISDEDMAGS